MGRRRRRSSKWHTSTRRSRPPGRRSRSSGGKLSVPDQPDHPVHRGRRHRPGHLAGQRARARRGRREGLRRQAEDRLDGSLRRREGVRQARLPGCPTRRSTAFREFLVGIKGPLTTPIGGGIRSLNVALRQMLDLYVCLRPVRWFKGVPSPVKRPGEGRHGDLPREHRGHLRRHRVRERHRRTSRRSLDVPQGQLPQGRTRRSASPRPTAIGIKPVSREGTERLVRAAIEYAIANKRKSVTLVHKGNIMKFTEGAFRNWGYALAEREFARPDLHLGAVGAAPRRPRARPRPTPSRRPRSPRARS